MSNLIFCYCRCFRSRFSYHRISCWSVSSESFYLVWFYLIISWSNFILYSYEICSPSLNFVLNSSFSSCNLSFKVFILSISELNYSTTVFISFSLPSKWANWFSNNFLDFIDSYCNPTWVNNFKIWSVWLIICCLSPWSFLLACLHFLQLLPN